jgi:hypothetical protein
MSAALLLVWATAASLAQSHAAPPADGCGEVVVDAPPASRGLSAAEAIRSDMRAAIRAQT